MQALYARLKSSGWVRFLLDPEDELFVSCWPMPELASSIVRGKKKGLLIGWYDERMAQEFLVGKNRSPGMTGFCASGIGGLRGAYVEQRHAPQQGRTFLYDIAYIIL
jgi:hypothetical protein